MASATLATISFSNPQDCQKCYNVQFKNSYPETFDIVKKNVFTSIDPAIPIDPTIPPIDPTRPIAPKSLLFSIFTPVRTSNITNILQDTFVPITSTFHSIPLKVNNVVLKAIWAGTHLITLCLDIATLAFRIITLAPRIWFNSLKHHGSLNFGIGLICGMVDHGVTITNNNNKHLVNSEASEILEITNWDQLKVQITDPQEHHQPVERSYYLIDYPSYA